MKRFYVEQLGYVQVEATRSFIVEVPDDFTEEQTEELLHDIDQQVPGAEGLEWKDDDDRKWASVDVDIAETDTYDADTVETEGATVIKLEDIVSAEKA